MFRNIFFVGFRGKFIFFVFNEKSGVINIARYFFNLLLGFRFFTFPF